MPLRYKMPAAAAAVDAMSAKILMIADTARLAYDKMPLFQMRAILFHMLCQIAAGAITLMPLLLADIADALLRC